MLKVFPIDFVRQALEQTLLYEHIKDNSLFGGENQVAIHSFYEQLKSQEEVDRFVETYRDLSDQQNRSGLILNGVLVSPENPTITNLYSCTIVPLTWTCSLRCTIGNRDNAIITINNLIERLKGRKVDIAQLNGVDFNGRKISIPFAVGTMTSNEIPANIWLKNGDYIGEANNTTQLNNLTSALEEQNIVPVFYETYEYVYCYVKYGGKLKVVAYLYDENSDIWKWHFIDDDGTYPDIIFPPEHTSFEKYKLSLSFDAIRCDEPRNLNAEEYCELSFSGSATLVNENVALGNDLLKISFQKKKIVAATDITFQNAPLFYLEPLEMPSGNNANTTLNQLTSNKFKLNTHTDGIALTLQYTFILDKSNNLIKQWFDYARYGTTGVGVNDISPNMIYECKEYWCSWGNYEVKTFKAKLVESTDIENTESDVLSLSISMQIQGDNN